MYKKIVYIKFIFLIMSVFGDISLAACDGAIIPHGVENKFF
jgi:hypothetical protein